MSLKDDKEQLSLDLMVKMDRSNLQPSLYLSIQKLQNDQLECHFHSIQLDAFCKLIQLDAFGRKIH